MYIDRFFFALIKNFINNLRQERRRRIHSMLSEDSLRKRHRATVISIHITLTSWLLEFVSNWFIVLLGCLGVQNNTLKFIMLVLDTFCCFILIPASYICNTEKVKEYINSIGWYTSFIDQFRSRIFKPIQNENIEMRIVTGQTIENQDMKNRKPPFSQHQMKLMRTKSQPTIKHNKNNEMRKRSLNIYSETLFDFFVY